MNKIVVCLSLSFFTCISVNAQLFITKTGFAGFYSSTPLEDIKAENNQVVAIIDIGKKQVAFSMLLKSFTFRKQLMQEHFNENYVESDKYPKAVFKGSFTGDVDPQKQQTSIVQVEGILTLHGVDRKISIPATFETGNDTLIGKAGFQLNPQDFNIKIPSLVRDKIAALIDVQVRVECKSSK
ncbi:MAG: YceI family protein [Chitinophagaceae bacterium]|nr:YceI family protein [Chitinophagaceae bacterium]MCW5929409.1 YceI family protein [Chitinophagaceae bacterium]